MLIWEVGLRQRTGNLLHYVAVNDTINNDCKLRRNTHSTIKCANCINDDYGDSLRFQWHILTSFSLNVSIKFVIICFELIFSALYSDLYDLNFYGCHILKFFTEAAHQNAVKFFCFFPLYNSDDTKHFIFCQMKFAFLFVLICWCIISII